MQRGSKDEQADTHGSVEAFFRAAMPAKEPARTPFYVPAVVTLTLVSIPFYWHAHGELEHPLGLPTWVWITLGCSAGISAVTAWGALRHWRDDEPRETP